MTTPMSSPLSSHISVHATPVAAQAARLARGPRTGRSPLFDEVDHEIMGILLHTPLLSAQDLTLFASLGRLSRTNLYQRMRQLRRRGLIEAVSLALLGKGHRACYVLSTRGYLQARMHSTSEAAGPTTMRSDQRYLVFWRSLLPRLPQYVQLQQVLQALCTQAPTLFAAWYGRACEVSWHWQRDIPFLQEPHPFASPVSVVVRFQVHVPLSSDRPMRGEHHHREDIYTFLIMLDTPLYTTGEINMWLRYLSANAHELCKAGALPLVIVRDELRRELWHHAMRKIWQVEQAHPSPVSSSRSVSILLGLLPELLQAPSIWQQRWQWLGWSHVDRCCQLREALSLWPFSLSLSPKWAQDDRVATALSPVHTGSELSRTHVQAWLKLSASHLDLLHHLARHSLLSTEEVATCLGVQPASAKRYLVTLSRDGWVQPASALFASPQVRARWLLTEQSLHWFSQMYQIPFDHLVVWWHLTHGNLAEQWDERSEGKRKRPRNKQAVPAEAARIVKRRHLAQVIGLYGFFCTLMERTQAHQQPQSDWREKPSDETYHRCWWQVGGERRFFHVHDGRSRANMRYGISHQTTGKVSWLSFWVEYTASSQSARTIKQKVHAYVNELVTTYGEADGPQPPSLLWIVPDPADEQRLMRVVREMYAEETAMRNMARWRVLVTTTSRLAHHGPLGEIWLEIVPTGEQLIATKPRVHFWENKEVQV